MADDGMIIMTVRDLRLDLQKMTCEGLCCRITKSLRWISVAENGRVQLKKKKKRGGWGGFLVLGDNTRISTL